MSAHTRNKIVLLAILISLAPGIFLLRFDQLDGSINMLLFFGRVGGVFGITLMMWLVLLASRGLSKHLTPDYLYLVKLHKWIGKYATLLILIHPIFYIAYYWFAFEVNLLSFDLSRNFSRSIFIGLIALILLLIIWFSSVTLRKKLGFRKWHLIHILTYIIVPVTLLHSWMIGSDPLAKTFWGVYTIIYFGLLTYQTLFNLNFFRPRYTVESTEQVADNTFTITLKPSGNARLNPQPGQFAYIKHRLIPETHPFSISDSDPQTGTINFTIKDLGPFSHVLETIQVGDDVTLDGPYGTFTWEAFKSTKPAVILAGGIGITPFMPLINKVASGWKKPIYLFFGNRSQQDIPFLDTLQELNNTNPDFTFVNVLESDEGANIPFEKGYISADTINKYLPGEIPDYDYYICGPPPMMAAMRRLFKQQGVPKQNQHFEQFS